MASPSPPHPPLVPPPGGNRFIRDPPRLFPGVPRSQTTSPFRLPMPFSGPGEVAFSAMQYLPVPVLVLDSLKTVVLANEAMGRLLGMMPDNPPAEGEAMVSVMDQLRGQSLSQVGIDLVQDGVSVWLDWEQFLDQAAVEIGMTKQNRVPARPPDPDGDATPIPRDFQGDANGIKFSRGDLSDHLTLEVVISPSNITRATFDPQFRSNLIASQTRAKMIISLFEMTDNRSNFFTLTFTSTHLAPALPPCKRRRSTGKTGLPETVENKTVAWLSNPPSIASSRDSTPSAHKFDPGDVSLTSTPFPPHGPPSTSSITSAPSILQKITIMKDALLDNIQTPILALWKDGSVALPNRAGRNLFKPNVDLEHSVDGFDLLPAWDVWTEDFRRQLEASEYPISELIRTETPFTGRRIGMHNAQGQRLVFEVEGVAIRDDNTGEFLAGVISLRDVTRITEEINRIKAADEERFRLICDTMPQLVWTTTPQGQHDFYNNRWYTYTGLTEEESLGLGWVNPFHPDDMPETRRRWHHSLKTGEPYVTEYRCRSKEGEWRWFLGRALPLRNKQTGAIEKWFGTCTDVHESIESKIEAKRTREQLLSVIALSHMTMFTVDLNRRITMLEGSLIWDSQCENEKAQWHIGQDVYDVFNRLNSQLPEGQMPTFLKPLDSVLAGTTPADYQEHEMDGRWYRTRFSPIVGKKNRDKNNPDTVIEGVIGLIMDVTELKAREKDIQAQAQERRQLLANEAAAKEASRLKSQFLANMSHEIRTPITGVIGMAELLLDVELNEEQRELTENIYRSANALLTVINDILDFSKVESGRLDIEEVQFSLSVIVRDVSKMLSFAAERKELTFQSDISPDIESDLVLMGDPGRVRQIITNLVTNSIKFTSIGHVKFSVYKERETPETIEIKFVIEDTGIGIEEEVKKRLFQPFSQGDSSTARKFGGTGLGLTICKNLLDLMKGRITLESTLGVGTTATFWIPFTRPIQGVHRAGQLVSIDPLSDRMSISCDSSEYDHVPNSNNGSSPGEFTHGTGRPLDKIKTHWRNNSAISLSTGGVGSPEQELSIEERANTFVLVVEDNAINQQIAIKNIQKLGFQVAAAWNGKEALDYLMAAQEGKKRKPDIILMDVQMPVIDGYKCTHMLRHHVPYKAYVGDVPIVAMTASAIQGDREKCKRAGMDDYLSKPVKSGLLERMLVRWSTKSRLSIADTGTGTGGSLTSDCSEAGEHCDNATIPGLELDHDFVDGNTESTPVFEDPSPRRPPLPPSLTVEFDKYSSAATPTPRPATRDSRDSDVSHFPGYTLDSPSKSSPGKKLTSPEKMTRRFSTQEELGRHGRDDKLIGAAGRTGADAMTSPLATAVEASSLNLNCQGLSLLTEENMEKLEEELMG
ncbi:putative signal transduction histidine-protein kinase [Podospora fimiseda]|uniref:histidine kinase n=1 Tax=Podospora fimiseda TaxID=252190 RepID=A0AAN7BND4_9PEZI|nr:putative signal transduction histidine-protein kinase [Podospora fimiseda]